MSTRLAKVGKMYAVSMVVGPGSRKRLPRNTILVPEGDPELLRKVLIEQADEARRIFGIKVPQEGPVA